MITTGFMDWKHAKMLLPDDGAGEGGEGTGGEAGAGASEQNDNHDDIDTAATAEIARLKAELAKAKAATDKATKEAGDYRKQLKSKMTADEAAAEEKRAQETELNDLRKRFAVAETTKKVMALGGDEAVSTKIAEYLYGAEDTESALAEIQKLWTAREKALRLEFQKIPAPSAGNADGPTITAEQFHAMGYLERVEFAQNHPEEYNKLMGR